MYSETVGIKEHMKDLGTINLEEAIVGFVPTLTLSWDYNKILKRDTGETANNGSGNANQNANPLMAGLGNLKTMETKSINLHSSLALWKTLPGLYVAIKGKQAKDYEYNDFLESFGLFFEDMAVRDLKVYAGVLGGEVFHYRDKSGLECDAVLHRRNGTYGLIEIKLGGEGLIEEGAANLKSLAEKIDTTRMKAPSFMMVLTGTGAYAYRRKDGVYVVPIGCLKD